MIKSQDIKIMHSERDTDFDDAGGHITGRELISGKSNNLFYGVDETERTTGKYAARKIFPSVVSYGDPILDEQGKPIIGADGEPMMRPETFQSASVIVDSNPEDKFIHGIIFTTNDWADKRKDADEFVTNYLIKSLKLNGQINGMQIKGQKSVGLVMKPEDTPPKVGDTLCLVQDEKKPSEIEQYVRISKVETEIRLIRIQGEPDLVPMLFVYCQITNALRYDFDGGPITIYDDVQDRAFARETTVVDAARYYGCKALKKDAEFGDLKIHLDSVYGQLVPANESSIAITDAQAGSDVSPAIESGDIINETIHADIKPMSRFLFVTGILPGTLEISVSGTVLKDLNGQIMNGDTPIGTVDYARGGLNFSSVSPTYTGRKQVKFKAASRPITPSNSVEIHVTDNNRVEIYNMTLMPIPEPGALIVSYRALNNWYDLRDNGGGRLSGAVEGNGVGTVNYETGTVSITLGALPDVGSDIIFTWGTKSTYYNRAKESGAEYPEIVKQLKRGYIQPSSLKIEWEEGDKIRKAHDDGKGGISGSMGGSINYSEGILRLKPKTLPASSALLSINYKATNTDGVRMETFRAMPLEPGKPPFYFFRLPDKDIVEGSVFVEFNLVHPEKSRGAFTTSSSRMIDSIQTARDIKSDEEDDPNGILEGFAGSVVDYKNGTVKFPPFKKVAAVKDKWKPNIMRPPNAWAGDSISAPKTKRVETRSQSPFDMPTVDITGIHHEGYDYVTVQAIPPNDGTQYCIIRYITSDEVEEIEEEFVLGEYRVKLNPRYQETVVMGSVRFTLGGKTYVDRDGSLYRDIDNTTGAGTYSGQINYETSEATISGWQEGSSPTIKIESLLTQINEKPIDSIVFRVPSAPIATNGLQINATRLDGTRIQATSDPDAEIKGNGMEGFVDYQTGVARVRFGRWVDPDGHEDEFWFDAGNIVDGKIFMPIPVTVPSVKYNAVIRSSMTVDEKYIGLDTTRLPSDGRVPIFRKGDIAVIHRHEEQIIPESVPKEHVIIFSDQRLNEAWIQDDEEMRIPCEYFEVDRVNGTLTIIDNDFSEFKHPLRAIGRVEDQKLVTDVQINGELSLNSPLTHDYPSGSLCSGALFIGNMQARYRDMFTQTYWDGVYEDYRESGENPSWTYDDVTYPIKLTNADCVQQRWAVVFDGGTTFKLFGETLGQVAIGDINHDLKPINPNTGEPYFILKSEGWGGGGHKPNHVLRFNTMGANHPVWIARSIEPSEPTTKGDNFNIRVRGSVNVEQ